MHTNTLWCMTMGILGVSYHHHCCNVDPRPFGGCGLTRWGAPIQHDHRRRHVCWTPLRVELIPRHQVRAQMRHQSRSNAGEAQLGRAIDRRRARVNADPECTGRVPHVHDHRSVRHVQCESCIVRWCRAAVQAHKPQTLSETRFCARPKHTTCRVCRCRRRPLL
jgi:hypothetical protein